MSAASYGKAMIESRKRADNAYKAMDSVIANDKKILQIAKFETNTANTIDRLVKQVNWLQCQEARNADFNFTSHFTSHFQQKENNNQKQRYEQTVNERRQQLADLYNYEIESWRAETIARVETQEDRKSRYG